MKANATYGNLDYDDIPVVACYHCHGGTCTTGCRHCNSTGKLFWVSGYSFPYTPEGEYRAEFMRKKLSVTNESQRHIR